jgi:hypothetical protein
MVMNTVPFHVTGGRWHVLRWTRWPRNNPWEVPLQVAINRLIEVLIRGLKSPSFDFIPSYCEVRKTQLGRDHTQFSRPVSHSVKV